MKLGRVLLGSPLVLVGHSTAALASPDPGSKQLHIFFPSLPAVSRVGRR